MEEVADEFMISGLQEDPDTLETMVVAAWQRPAVGVAAVDSTIKLLSSLFVAGLSITAELSKSSTVNTVVSQDHTPVVLKMAFMFAWVNERS
jgi:hypothetical protein